MSSAEIASVQDQLVCELGAKVLRYPECAEDVLALGKPDVMVFLSTTRRGCVGGMDEATRQQLRRYVEAGGRMLLLGFATRLVHEIGIEPQAPDRVAVYRWGDTDRTLLGQYRFGIKLQNPEGVDLVEGLKGACEPGPVAEQDGQHVQRQRQRKDAFHLGGGEMVSAQSCHWERTGPKKGQVVARLYRMRDGEPRELGAAVLTAWGASNGGKVLAYGNLPEPWRQDPEIRHNARQFLRNAIRSLCTDEDEDVVPGRFERPEGLVVFVDGRRKRVVPKALPSLAERDLPGAVLVPHWGWQVPLVHQRDGRQPIAPQVLVDQVLMPSWRAGASLLDLHLWDSERGYPLAWDLNDPLRRVRTYQGGAFLSEWRPPVLQQLAKAAHQRSMLVQTWLCPDPTRQGPPVEILA
ncbi:MAG: hypothetical protein V3U11_13775, partial [Planctomycetota bacterium]